jgi:hypothetical protein
VSQLKRALQVFTAIAIVALCVWGVTTISGGSDSATIRAKPTAQDTGAPAVDESPESIDRFTSTFTTMPIFATISYFPVPLDRLVAEGDALLEGELHDIVVGPEVRITPTLVCEGGEVDCLPPVYHVTAEFVLVNARMTPLRSSEGARDVGTVRVRMHVGNANVDRGNAEAFVARLRESAPLGIKYAALVADNEGALAHQGVNSAALITSDGTIHPLEWSREVAGSGIGEAATIDDLYARIR